MELHNAVRSAYPNAAFVRGNDANSIVAETVNGEPITVNSATITAKITELQESEAAAQTAKQAASNSATSKLKALGLTDDEISALKGTL
jgi:hypothetical protein